MKLKPAGIEEIMRFLIREAVVFPTAEIYSSKQAFSGFYTFGHLGTLLVEEIKRLWRRRFIWSKERVYEISGSILTPTIVWKASGHLDSFWDPIVFCTRCNRTFRADHLIEEKLNLKAEGKSVDELTEIIRSNGLKCPVCGGVLSDVRRHYLMFKTKVGVSVEDNAVLRPETAQVIFLSYPRIRNVFGKPPFGIAQIGRSYRNEISPRRGLFRLREFEQMEIEYFVLRDARCIPFSREEAERKGIVGEDLRYRPKCMDCKRCQVNNCPYFTEEYRKTLLRILTREAQLKGSEEVVEITADEAVKRGILPNEWMAYVLAEEVRFLTEDLGVPFNAIRFREMLPEETPHYSAGNFDLEICFSFGWKEIVGNAYRTDYDLTKHMKMSGVKMLEEVNGVKVVPHVIEPSIGIERTILTILSYAYVKAKVDRKYDWLKLHRKVAPVKAAVLPLMMPREYAKEESKIARDIWRRLCEETEYHIVYDEKGSIGSRYKRYDQWGVPYCITVDVDTMRDNTVTIRDRDTRKQVRVKLEKIPAIVTNLIKGRIKFSHLE
ncbi:MAG TPA: glycine--tRNA ligase [Thermoprotei archaeon]|nr:glycine--tRNA ligase [Thermoprotei archaeon]